MTEKIPVVVIVGGLAAAKARRRVSIRRLDLSFDSTVSRVCVPS
jgi:hypothetical protein